MQGDITIDGELAQRIGNADAIITSYKLVPTVEEYTVGDPTLFSPECDSLGYHLIEDGRIATQVGMGALDSYDDVVSVWVNDNDQLVSDESTGNKSGSDETANDEDSGNPSNCDTTSTPDLEADVHSYETCEAVLRVINRHNDALPDKHPSELDERDRGRHEALMDLGLELSRWLEQIPAVNQAIKYND